MTNLQEWRIVTTKVHEGHTYELDNRELFRILMNTMFTSSTLDNVVWSHQRHNDRLAAWTAILANVEGANYVSELKRQGDQIIDRDSLTRLRISLSKRIWTNTSSPMNYMPLQCHQCLNGRKLINSWRTSNVATYRMTTGRLRIFSNIKTSQHSTIRWTRIITPSSSKASSSLSVSLKERSVKLTHLTVVDTAEAMEPEAKEEAEVEAVEVMVEEDKGMPP